MTVLFLYSQEKLRSVVNTCPIALSATTKTFTLPTSLPDITAFTVIEEMPVTYSCQFLAVKLLLPL